MKTSARCWWMLLAAAVSLQPAAVAQSADPTPSQRFFDITVGLGVGAHSAPSIADYINAVAQPRMDQRLDEFSSAVEFFIMPELQVGDDWSAGVEYSFLVKSYAIDAQSGSVRSDMSYQVHMPTAMVHYLVFGERYRLKFGGGVGYHIGRFNQSFPAYGADETFQSDGLGVKLSAVGNTQFDETFFGSIGLDLRWDFLGPLKRGDGGNVVDRVTGIGPKMNFFTVGLKFGVMFQL